MGCMKYSSLLHCICFAIWSSRALTAFLEPGIETQAVTLDKNTRTSYVAFTRSAYKNTKIEVRLYCGSNSPEFKFSLNFVGRSSPCDKEFNEVLSSPNSSLWLERYYNDDSASPLNYPSYYAYAAEMTKGGTLSCSTAGETLIIATENFGANAWTQRQIKGRSARSPPEPEKSASDKPADTAGSRTEHVATTLPADAIYLLLFKLDPIKLEKNVSLEIEVSWRGDHGYLGAIDWPLLPFYGAMCGVYFVFALAWLIVSAVQWRDLLRVQFWIGGVIFLGMLEKAVFYGEYQTMNAKGSSIVGAIQLAEVISCVKKTLARMLIIIVSVGFGVVKPRLGSTMHKVVGVGFLYFVLCSIEGVSRVSKVQVDAPKQKQLIALPLTLIEVGICWWIFSALLTTMRALRLRRNETKLWLYRHFTNTLVFAVLASVAFMIWSLVMHVFTQCLKDWTELWVDVAFWHLLFSVMLLVIMILWRPSINNQRYAFTPLLDDHDDEEEEDDPEDTLFSSKFTPLDDMQLKNIRSSGAKKAGKDEGISLEDELKWVEENIPSSLADKALPALIDSDEERRQTKFEVSKMQ